MGVDASWDRFEPREAHVWKSRKGSSQGERVVVVLWGKRETRDMRRLVNVEVLGAIQE